MNRDLTTKAEGLTSGWWRAGMWAWLAFGLGVGPALAAQETASAADPEAKEAISKIRSPFCPGLMLEVCPTSQAKDLRDSIHALAETGLGADSLVELIVAGYGEEYRAYPKRSGAGLWAWLMPPIFLILGLGLVVVALRHMKEPEGMTGADPISAEEEARLEEALAQLDGGEA